MHSLLRLLVPPLSARVSAVTIASTLARLIASGAATTKADLVRSTGLSRSTVDGALRALFESSVIRHRGLRPTPGRGRPAEALEIDPNFGHVLVIDCGTRVARISVFDLGQRLLASAEIDIVIADGPVPVLDQICRTSADLVAEFRETDRPLVIVLGVPGPVDHRLGTLVRPPIMPGWDGFEVSQYVSAKLGGHVVLENDVNLRALGEARAAPEDFGPLLYVKIGAGIGGGIVTATGELFRGGDGAAGDIGHIPVPGATAVCRCGNIGCLEAVASVLALANRFATPGSTPQMTEDILQAVRNREPAAVSLVHDAAISIGEVIATIAHVINPSNIVLGGCLVDATDDVLSTVRGVVYSRALPLATRHLAIGPSVLKHESGTAGGLVVGMEQALTVDVLAAQLSAALRARRVSRTDRSRGVIPLDRAAARGVWPAQNPSLVAR